MSMIDDLKEKAAGYLENAGKKKDDLVETAADLKKKYDETQRKKTEDWVYKKEPELKKLDETLTKREELIRKKEQRLNQRFFTRFVGVTSVLSVMGFFALASNLGMFEKGSAPYTSREAAVYSTFNDVDANNPNFDVGRYCLNKEKAGAITFEDCLAVGAAKIMANQR